MGQGTERKWWTRRSGRQDRDRPAWWRPTPAGPVTFHPSVRTAAEIVATDAPPLPDAVSHPSAA